MTIAPTVNSVDALPDETAQLAFVTKFRELMRLKNVLTTFAEFKDADLALEPQKFEDYKSKYLDLHDSVKKKDEKEKTSILEDVDFELSLIHRDEINVAYILNLLVAMRKMKPEDAAKRKKEIVELLAGDVNLRSKRELIQEFIEENLPKLKPEEDIVGSFVTYWDARQKSAFAKLCEDEKIDPSQLEKILGTYAFANRLPRDQEIVASLTYKPKILERKPVLVRIAEKIQEFIATFIEGMGGV